MEDNFQMRRLIRSVVADLADSISECGDGSEALAAYAAQQPDWVLMDIEMKTLDGITATRLLKSEFPAARIVILTEYDQADWRDEAERAGAFDYVLKENLFDVRRILTGQARRRRIDHVEP